MRNKTQEKKLYEQKVPIYALIIVFINYLIFSVILTFSLNTKPYNLLHAFIRSLFAPTPNLCLSCNINNINTLKLLYCFYLILLVIIIALSGLAKSSKIPWRKLSYQLVSYTTVIFIVSLCCFQIASRLRYLGKEFLFVHRPTSEISKMINFSDKARKLIPGRHQAKILSDQNLKQDPYQLFHRTLAYYLYPEFSARFDNGKPLDCIFYFDKNDYTKDIPEGYQIIYTNSSKYFAIAVKEEIVPDAN